MVELGQLYKRSDEFAEYGVQVVPVTLDAPEQLAPARKKSEAEFQFFADPEGALADAFGLRHEGGNPANGADIVRPASILVRSDGAVLGAIYAENYRVRPDPDTILAAVENALAKAGRQPAAAPVPADQESGADPAQGAGASDSGSDSTTR